MYLLCIYFSCNYLFMFYILSLVPWTNRQLLTHRGWMTISSTNYWLFITGVQHDRLCFSGIMPCYTYIVLEWIVMQMYVCMLFFLQNLKSKSANHHFTWSKASTNPWFWTKAENVGNDMNYFTVKLKFLWHFHVHDVTDDVTAWQQIQPFIFLCNWN